jgi:hypothetical protein
MVRGDRLLNIGATWVVRAGVVVGGPHHKLTGRAWVMSRKIVAPWPSTTTRRLYVLAHEIGHVILRHGPGRPVYVREYEAEMFAHRLLPAYGLDVPEVETVRSKKYVSRKIERGFSSGLSLLDTGIQDWCEPHLSQRLDGSKFSAMMTTTRYSEEAGPRLLRALATMAP